MSASDFPFVSPLLEFTENPTATNHLSNAYNNEPKLRSKHNRIINVSGYKPTYNFVCSRKTQLQHALHQDIYSSVLPFQAHLSTALFLPCLRLLDCLSSEL